MDVLGLDAELAQGLRALLARRPALSDALVLSASGRRLIPAAPGTGVVAGGTVRAMMETVGVTDCLTKCYGSTTKLSVVKAVFDALSQIQTPAQVAEIRGVEIATTEIDAKIERGKRFAPATRTGENDSASSTCTRVGRS